MEKDDDFIAEQMKSAEKFLSETQEKLLTGEYKIVQQPWVSYLDRGENFFIPPNRDKVCLRKDIPDKYGCTYSLNILNFSNGEVKRVTKDAETPGVGGTTFNIVLDKEFGPSDVLPSPFKLIDEEVLKNFSFADIDKESELIEIHAMIPEGSLIVPPHLIKEWARIVINKVLE